MESDGPVDTGRFVRQWLLHTTLAWPVALVLTLTIYLIFNAIFARGFFGLPRPDWLQFLHMLLTFVPMGAFVGAHLGQAQYDAMRDGLRWDMTADWHRASLTGGILGGVGLVGVQMLAAGDSVSTSVALLLMPLFALAMGASQWLILRHFARDAWLWVLANGVGGVVFSGLFFLNQPPYASDLILAGLWLVATVAQSAVTAYVILWLYERGARERDDQRARVYVEIYTDDHPRR